MYSFNLFMKFNYYWVWCIAWRLKSYICLNEKLIQTIIMQRWYSEILSVLNWYPYKLIPNKYNCISTYSTIKCLPILILQLICFQCIRISDVMWYSYQNTFMTIIISYDTITNYIYHLTSFYTFTIKEQD